MQMLYKILTGQTNRWLLENDVGWVVWIIDEFRRKGDRNELMHWQKERLREYVETFPSVTCHLQKKIQVSYLHVLQSDCIVY